MKMESDDVIPNKNHEAVRFSDHGKIRFKPTYVGIDRTNNCMYNGKMYPRLKLARNLLTDDGVIFISIDDNEVSNLKNICESQPKLNRIF
jgi:adenine specific DNA methylase Mod